MLCSSTSLLSSEMRMQLSSWTQQNTKSVADYRAVMAQRETVSQGLCTLVGVAESLFITSIAPDSGHWNRYHTVYSEAANLPMPLKITKIQCKSEGWRSQAAAPAPSGQWWEASSRIGSKKRRKSHISDPSPFHEKISMACSPQALPVRVPNHPQKLICARIH